LTTRDLSAKYYRRIASPGWGRERRPESQLKSRWSVTSRRFYCSAPRDRAGLKLRPSLPPVPDRCDLQPCHLPDPTKGGTREVRGGSRNRSLEAALTGGEIARRAARAGLRRSEQAGGTPKARVETECGRHMRQDAMIANIPLQHLVSSFSTDPLLDEPTILLIPSWLLFVIAPTAKANTYRRPISKRQRVNPHRDTGSQEIGYC